MGLGHLVRCQSLAEMIKNKYRISFYCRLIPEAIQKNLVESGFQIKIIREEKEFFDTLQAGDGVVIDGYSFGPVDRKGTRRNSSHVATSYAVFVLKKKKGQRRRGVRVRS